MLRVVRLNPPEAIFLCDNRAAVEGVFSGVPWETTISLKPNMDVISAIRRLKSQSGVRMTGKWVRSHAERRKSTPSPEQVKNILADELATSASADHDTPIIDLKYERFTIKSGRPIVSQHSLTVKWILDRGAITQYIRGKSKIPDPRGLYMEGFFDSWIGLSTKKAILTSKIVYGWAYTSSRAENIDQRYFSCSHCNQPEDHAHMWTCQAQEPKALRIRILNQLKQKLSRTPPTYPVIDIPNFLLANERFESLPPNCLLEYIEAMPPFQIVSGFLGKHIQSTIDSTNVTRARATDGGKGMKLVRTTNWHLLTELWRLRNDTKYGKGSTGRTKARHEMLMNKADKISELIPFCDDEERRIVAYMSLNDKPCHVIAAWIEATESQGRQKFEAAIG